MCGISGYFYFERERAVKAEVLKRMTDIISHRGPDGEGFYVRDNVALGHRRLAIIDLEGGQQPMYSSDGKIVIVFNGEIYNYLELKNELITHGNKFVTGSDTEVIINAYRTWGTDCQNRFNGMWAFALWDMDKQQLFISRDRIGEKPLYYSIYDNSLIFGSEIKSILEYGFSPRPRLDVLELYFTLGFVPSPYTFYKDIFQLMPGNFMLADTNGYKIRTYWNLPDVKEDDLQNDKKLVEDQFKYLFEDSVRLRMRSDVPFGAFLSGGLDSSCVVATMATHTPISIETFTIGFDHKEFDETPLAQEVADKFCTHHHVGTVIPEDFEDALNKVLFHYDIPFGDSSAIPTGHVSRFASQYVKMVLTGDGGDEVLSGYTIYQGELFAKKYQSVPKIIRNILPYALDTIAKPLRGSLRYKLNRAINVLKASNQPFEQRLASKLCFTSIQHINELMQPAKDTISFYDFYGDVMKNCRFTDPFYKLMHFQLKVTLPDDMLTKVDRMSMASSIETRIPFLDTRIVELMYLANKELKMEGYKNKIVLRNTIANDTLPPNLLAAPKRGFGVPLREWFKDKNLVEKLKNNLLNDEAKTVLNPSTVIKLITENETGKGDQGTFIWQLLLLSRWLHAQNV